tara:strand:+ start:285 stop:467 length:183 start_codon:yes stop_codon:yes gene_type:complete
MNENKYGVLTELSDNTLVYITVGKSGKFNYEYYEELATGLEPIPIEKEPPSVAKYTGTFE